MSLIFRSLVQISPSFRNISFKAFGFSLLMIGVICLAGCLNKADLEGQNKYSFHVLDKDGKEIIVTSNGLDSGVIKPEERSEFLADSMSRNMIVKNGYYYQSQRKSGTFNKYELKGSKLKQVGQIQLQDYEEENFIWLGEDTLLLTGLNHKLHTPKYYIVDTRKMSLIKQGLLDIGRPTGKFNTMSIGFVLQKAKNLLIGYSFHATNGSGFTTSDTMYVSTLSYPDMRNLGVQKETRSTYPAGVNSIQHNEFTDENGDFYFMSCPGIAMGNRPDLPTAIFRIKANSLQLDQQYFFNLSAAIKNHAYGFWYVGDGKAIIRAERKDLFKGLADHYSVPHFEFYVIDIANQKVIKKLDLPLDKGTRKECVLVEGDTVYIAVNSKTDGNYIWNYHLKSGKLSKGLQLAGVTEFIVRLDVLNP